MIAPKIRALLPVPTEFRQQIPEPIFHLGRGDEMRNIPILESGKKYELPMITELGLALSAYVKKKAINCCSPTTKCGIASYLFFRYFLLVLCVWGLFSVCFPFCLTLQFIPLILLMNLPISSVTDDYCS